MKPSLDVLLPWAFFFLLHLRKNCIPRTMLRHSLKPFTGEGQSEGSRWDRGTTRLVLIPGKRGREVGSSEFMKQVDVMPSWARAGAPNRGHSGTQGRQRPRLLVPWAVWRQALFLSPTSSQAESQNIASMHFINLCFMTILTSIT